MITGICDSWHRQEFEGEVKDFSLICWVLEVLKTKLSLGQFGSS